MAETRKTTRNGLKRTGVTSIPAANDAVKYRAYPTDTQYELIAKTIGSCRYYWNLIKDIETITHEQTNRTITIQPAEAKKWDECEFLTETDSLALATTYSNYIQAWQNHREDPKKYGRPTWKKRQGLEGSYSTYNQPKWDAENSCLAKPGTIWIEDGKIQLPKVGWVKIREHMRLPEGAVIKNVTVSRDCAGRVFISVGYYNPELAKLLEDAGLDTDKDALVVTGLDYSNPYMFVTESGYSPDNVHYYKQSQAKFAKLQRKLARRQPGSSNYKKLQLRIARLHRKIANQRNDLLHKLSYELATKCDVVCVEDLDLRAMTRRRKGRGYSFGASVSDNAWGKFLVYLAYKLERHHGQLVRVGRYYPSSKRCHHCGAVLDELGLSTRSWVCPSCGAVHDRDVNAAWNILLEGVRMLRAGEVDGASVPDAVKFRCAGGMPVTAETLRAGFLVLGSVVLPVEECKTAIVAPVWDYLVPNSGLRCGCSGLSETGIKEGADAGGSALGEPEAPTSTLTA